MPAAKAAGATRRGGPGLSDRNSEGRTVGRFGALGAAALTALIVFVLDQASKIWVLDGLGLREKLQIDVFPPLKFMLAYNTGVNFGLFASGSGVQIYILSGFALVVSVLLFIWSARSDSRLLALGCGLAAGGALANALDRLRVGAVIDFVNLDCCGIGNPYAFNLADCAIFVGAALIAVTAWSGEPDRAAGNQRGA